MLTKLLPTPSDFPPEKRPTLRKNISVNLIDGSLYVFGMSFIAIPTVIPVFIKELGGSTMAVGSVHVLWTLGMNIPAAFVAQRLKGKSLFKPQMMIWGFFHRFLLFVSAVMIFLIVGKISSAISVPFFLLLLFLMALFGSMSGLPWFQVYTKTVPVRLRGRMMGLRQLIGSFAGVFGGYLVIMILEGITFPINFSLLFFISFMVTMLSLYFLTKIEEHPTERTENDPLFSARILDDAKRLIRTDANFRNFLFVDSFILMSMSAISFYSIFALEKFSLSPAYAGTFSVIVMTTNIFANIAFGLTADYFGHKVNILAVSICLVLASFVAIFSTNIVLYGFAFVFIAAALQVHNISRMPFLAEISSEQERPLYVGISNSITAFSSLLGIIFGAVIPYVGYEFIFAVTALLAIIASVIISRNVTEPRYAKVIQ